MRTWSRKIGIRYERQTHMTPWLVIPCASVRAKEEWGKYIEDSVFGRCQKPWCINWINFRDHFSPYSKTVGCCWDGVEGAFERQTLHSKNSFPIWLENCTLNCILFRMMRRENVCCYAHCTFSISVLFVFWTIIVFVLLFVNVNICFGLHIIITVYPYVKWIIQTGEYGRCPES